MLKITFFNQMPYIEDRTGWPYYHGDCAYIEFPNGKNMLVDISTKFSGAFLTQRLVEMQVRNIDYFVVSHLHQDHTAGFSELTKHISVSNVVWSGYGKDNTDADRTVLKEAQERGIVMHQVRIGDKMQLGDVCLEVLFPTQDAPDVADNIPVSEHGLYLNLYSMVFRLSYGKFSALFTGDIHYETEEQLVQIHGDKLQSTLLKIPHHGNDTSTGQLLVDTVKPQVAVVMSTGCEWIVLRKFSSPGIPLYGTYCDGTIIARTDGTILTMECEKGCREFIL